MLEGTMSRTALVGIAAMLVCGCGVGSPAAVLAQPPEPTPTDPSTGANATSQVRPLIVADAGAPLSAANSRPAATTPFCPAGARLEPGRGCVPGTAVALPPRVNRGRCPAGMAQMEGGNFEMGSSSGAASERPVQSLSLSTYCLDVTEVSATAYEACVASGDCRKRQAGDPVYGPRNGHWEQACTAAAGNLGNHPINCITTSDADGYCAWKGKRLPSEAEWEYAARGGSQQRLYPWGPDAPSARRVNACGRECSSASGGPGLYADDDGYANTAPVGGLFAGAGRWGVLHLGGNVSEWTATPFCPRLGDTSCQDDRRVVRGGSFLSEDASAITTSRRWPVDPKLRRVDVGFRCALSLDSIH